MRNAKYVTKKNYRNYPAGTEMTVRGYDDTHVFVSVDETVERIPFAMFNIITGAVCL